jgi:hypothetical protein
VVCIGGTASFRLTVQNVGTANARDVALSAAVPATVRTDRLAANRRARVRGGTATWVFTRIPPGERRVVSGSVRVASATPGLTTTHLTASASHTNLASKELRVRATRCARGVIPVTG